MRYDLLVIGGGVSGFSAAITAARQGASVCILERGRKPLRKLAASGNGRGNLLNLHPSCDRYHGNPDFAMNVLGEKAAEESILFWQSIGVSLCVLEDELVYPSSLWAQSAVDCMLLAAGQLGIEVRTGFLAEHIKKEEEGFSVSGQQTIFAAEKKPHSKKQAVETSVTNALLYSCNVLVCGGGRASLAENDPDAYSLLTEYGHRVTELRSALCALCTVQKPDDELQGVRVRCKCRLLSNQTIIRESSGEALFTKDGVSGIAVMDLARHAVCGDILQLDLTQSVCGKAEADPLLWLAERRKIFPAANCACLFIGAMHPALSRVLLERCKISECRLVSSLKQKELQRLADEIAAFSFTIVSARSLQQAQVTAGGIQTDLFDFSTMQSRLCHGLYSAGEMLNVDGDCGGFNLLFAVVSGIRAGKAIALL